MNMRFGFFGFGTGINVMGIFVTFQIESGDRMELNVTGHVFGMLIEGDWGNLIFQGTRYLGFKREMEENDETVI